MGNEDPLDSLVNCSFQDLNVLESADFMEDERRIGSNNNNPDDLCPDDLFEWLEDDESNCNEHDVNNSMTLPVNNNQDHLREAMEKLQQSMLRTEISRQEMLHVKRGSLPLNVNQNILENLGCFLSGKRSSLTVGLEYSRKRVCLLRTTLCNTRASVA